MFRDCYRFRDAKSYAVSSRLACGIPMFSSSTKVLDPLTFRRSRVWSIWPGSLVWRGLRTKVELELCDGEARTYVVELPKGYLMEKPVHI